MIIEAREDVVRLEGALDRDIWPVIQAAANLLLRSHVQGIIIDGSGITRCTPEGAKTFTDAMDYIARYHARIVVCGLPDDITAAVRTVPGVRSRLSLATSIDEARASLSLVSHRGATAGGRELQDILVPLLGRLSADTSTALARRLARSAGRKTRIHLMYVLEVPRTLPLAAPLPEEEAEASRIMDEADAILKREGLTASRHVSRARDAGEEIIAQASQLGVTMIVLAYAPADASDDDVTQRVTRVLATRSPCELILNKTCPAA